MILLLAISLIHEASAFLSSVYLCGSFSIFQSSIQTFYIQSTTLFPTVPPSKTVQILFFFPERFHAACPFGFIAEVIFPAKVIPLRGITSQGIIREVLLSKKYLVNAVYRQITKKYLG